MLYLVLLRTSLLRNKLTYIRNVNCNNCSCFQCFNFIRNIYTLSGIFILKWIGNDFPITPDMPVPMSGFITLNYILLFNMGIFTAP